MNQSHFILRALVVLLALAGLVVSLYFTLAYYGRVRKSRRIPELLCAREGSSCVTVLQTPYARVFGVPNSLLGIFYYLLLIFWALWGHARLVTIGRVLIPAVSILVALSAATLVLGFYLIDALRRKLRIDCPMCYLAHAVNAALFALLLLMNSSF